MKELNLLVWMTQLGLSLAVPMGSFIFLGFWLHHSLGWGKWVLILGIVAGVLSGVRSLIQALRFMSRMAPKEPSQNTEAFNDHI